MRNKLRTVTFSIHPETIFLEKTPSFSKNGDRKTSHQENLKGHNFCSITRIMHEQELDFTMDTKNNGCSLAVLLNGNARRVSNKTYKILSEFVSDSDLYFSSSIPDSRIIARKVVDKRYRSILIGGGDGTFTTFATHIHSYIEREGINHYNPRFGVLRLGTGNALASTFGATTSNKSVLQRELYFASNGASVKNLYLIEVEGKRTPFSGLGLDAMILNDYCKVKEMMNGTLMQSTSKGLMGYWLGIIGLSIPKYIFGKVVEAVVVNDGDDAIRIGKDGKRMGPVIRKGDVIYKGPMRMLSASKVPYYGFEFKLFPFAMIRDDKFHLRIHKASALEILGNLPSVWKGNYHSESVFDFLADEVSVYLSSSAPFQIGGDGEGKRSYVKFSLTPKPLPIIDFKTTTE